MMFPTSRPRLSRWERRRMNEDHQPRALDRLERYRFLAMDQRSWQWSWSQNPRVHRAEMRVRVYACSKEVQASQAPRHTSQSRCDGEVMLDNRYMESFHHTYLQRQPR